MNEPQFFPTSIPILHSGELTMRELNLEEVDQFYELSLYRNPEYNLEQAGELIKTIQENFQNREALNWGMYLGEELIGTCGYYRGFANNQGEIGFVIRKKFRRQGWTLKAAKRAIQYGFEDLRLDLITAYVRDDNFPSQQLIAQLGFERTEEKPEDHRRYELPKNRFFQG
ncbi:GNAT family N-acetyltransferase [bacterium SCSIO 12741]|nr:GNAT family N-acetyltransferase [bacterium SCSIO 12741]